MMIAEMGVREPVRAWLRRVCANAQPNLFDVVGCVVCWCWGMAWHSVWFGFRIHIRAATKQTHINRYKLSITPITHSARAQERRSQRCRSHSIYSVMHMELDGRPIGKVMYGHD